MIESAIKSHKCNDWTLPGLLGSPDRPDTPVYKHIRLAVDKAQHAEQRTTKRHWNPWLLSRMRPDGAHLHLNGLASPRRLQKRARKLVLVLAQRLGRDLPARQRRHL